MKKLFWLPLAILLSFAGVAFAQSLSKPATLNYTELTEGGAAEAAGNRLVIGGTIDVITSGVLKLGGVTVSATAAELNAYPVYGCIEDISSAQSDWVVAPHAGAITSIWSVIDGAITVADANLSFEIAGTPVTDGGILVATAGSAAGTVDSSTPSAANVVTAGQAIEMITDGGSTTAAKVCITMLIAR